MEKSIDEDEVVHREFEQFGDSKKGHPFRVAMEIVWDSNETEERELEHFGGAPIDNNLVTVKRGIHLKFPWR